MLQNAYDLFPSFLERSGDRPECCVKAQTARRSESEEKFDHLVAKTQESFGYQWTTFSEMVCDFRENFLNYLSPATPEFFRGRLGLDAGCGVWQAYLSRCFLWSGDGRGGPQPGHRRYVHNTKHFPNVHMVQADMYATPFAQETFDFVYCIGVLHHLPDPPRGLRAPVPLLKSNGSLFLWLYSKNRRVSNFVVELLRTLTIHLPYPFLKKISFLGAILDQYAFILPYQTMGRIPGVERAFEKIVPARIKIYSRYPFQVLQADWFDRLAAPIRVYFTQQGVDGSMHPVGLSDIRITSTGRYGWRGCGITR